MKDVGLVRGSKEASQSLIVGKNLVYVHTNVRQITVDELKEQFPDRTDDELNDIEEYEYNEVQYTKDEYIKMQAELNQANQDQITELQLALTEISEGGTE